ncbi:hypothetical protein CBI35_19620 [Pantoea sp. AV62]|nr:hypothetical protein CBI35_19620 [Pantoea sp. AV62]
MKKKYKNIASKSIKPLADYLYCLSIYQQLFLSIVARKTPGSITTISLAMPDFMPFFQTPVASFAGDIH